MPKTKEKASNPKRNLAGTPTLSGVLHKRTVFEHFLLVLDCITGTGSRNMSTDNTVNFALVGSLGQQNAFLGRQMPGSQDHVVLGNDIQNLVNFRQAQDIKWLKKSELYNVDWLPADLVLIPEIQKELIDI